MVTVAHLTPHAKRHLVRSSRFCRVPCRYITDRPTDRQTDRPSTETSVAICRIYAMHTMRRNNHRTRMRLTSGTRRRLMPQHNPQEEAAAAVEQRTEALNELRR